jgi:hypothetical protein
MSPQKHAIHCAACGCEGEASVTGIMDIAKALPKRWKRRLINKQAYILCDVCGHPRHFTTGLSRYLQDRLSLPENATCEVDEIDDFLVGGKVQRKSRGSSRPDLSHSPARPRAGGGSGSSE